MTDDEVLAELRSNSALNQARRKFSSWAVKIDRLTQQSKPISPIEMRRMEFQAVIEIVATYGHAMKMETSNDDGRPGNWTPQATD